MPLYKQKAHQSFAASFDLIRFIIFDFWLDIISHRTLKAKVDGIPSHYFGINMRDEHHDNGPHCLVADLMEFIILLFDASHTSTQR